MRIWKFGLIVTDYQEVTMPQGAQLLCVQTQGDQPQLWALVDETSLSYCRRTVAMYGTGNPLPSGDLGKYIGTFQMHGGALVFHAFDLGEEV